MGSGTLVLPAPRLPEFPRAQSANRVRARWRLSCLVGTEVDADLSAIASLQVCDGARVDSLEAKAQTVGQVNRLMDRLPDGLVVYFEVQPNCSIELLPTIHQLGARAKIRLGGVIPDAIPSTDTVADFIVRCVSLSVPFKATAGLHHPLRCFRPLSYEADAPRARMHGFLNVFLAAALAYQGASAEQLTAMLDTEKAERFCFENARARCADMTLSTDQVRVAHEQFAVSFGSCSFEEPIEDLQLFDYDVCTGRDPRSEGCLLGRIRERWNDRFPNSESSVRRVSAAQPEWLTHWCRDWRLCAGSVRVCDEQRPDSSR